MLSRARAAEKRPSTSAQLALVIHELRGHRVILDSDLARIYGVETRALVEGGEAKPREVPFGFCFFAYESRGCVSKITICDLKEWRSASWRSPFFAPLGLHRARSCHGRECAPLAGSDGYERPRRACVRRTRRALAAHAELAHELQKLKHDIAAKFGEHDEQFRIVCLAIEQLILSTGAEAVQESEKDRLSPR